MLLGFRLASHSLSCKLMKMPIPFCKFHGFGNDYIVIEREHVPKGLDQIDLALAMCQRHTGVGSDGIAIIERRDGGEADFFVRS